MTPEERASEVVNGDVGADTGHSFPAVSDHDCPDGQYEVLNLTNKAFRERVAAAIREAVAAEREALLAAIDDVIDAHPHHAGDELFRLIKAAFRARP